MTNCDEISKLIITFPKDIAKWDYEREKKGEQEKRK